MLVTDHIKGIFARMNLIYHSREGEFKYSSYLSTFIDISSVFFYQIIFPINLQVVRNGRL